MTEDELDGFLDQILDEESDKGSGDEDDLDGFLESVEQEEETQVPEQADTPVACSEGRGCSVYYTSSEDMSMVEDESVDLIVTSPPYNADWAYGSHDDSMDYEQEYLPMLARVFKECWRVLKPTGRLCVNVPSLLRGGASGGQSIISDIDGMLNSSVMRWQPSELDGHDDILSCMDDTQFVHREFVIWNKGFNTDGLAPNGSFPRPVGVLLNNMHEAISIYQKPGDRSYDDMPDETIENSKINKQADDLCDDVWTIHPENHDFKFAEEESVPPYPKELPLRCIRLWSYKGDTVLDPFTGRGTTMKAAIQLGRDGVGFEIRESLKKDIEEYTGMNNSGLDDWQ